MARSDVTAGVNWRSDGMKYIERGEEIAIRILREQRPCYCVFSQCL